MRIDFKKSKEASACCAKNTAGYSPLFSFYSFCTVIISDGGIFLQKNPIFFDLDI